MSRRQTLLVLTLAAIVIVSCTCSWLPIGPRLTESRRLGAMTIHYPEDWYTDRVAEILLISSEEIPEDSGDLYDLAPQPMFIAVYGEQDEWLSRVHEDPGDLLDEIADEIFAESIGREETVEGRGVSWLRATAEGTFDLFDEPVFGWLAVTIRGDEFAFVLAVAPEGELAELEDVYDAMLERIEFD
jgi:hypothetical protein